MHRRQGVKQERGERRSARQERKAAKREHIEQAKTSALAQHQPAAAAASTSRPSSPYVPSLGLLFRIFSLIRITAALSAPMQDCDEVFNYWEPLHMLQFGTGKQTWEYAPQFALRSYAFLKIYQALAWLLHVGAGFGSKTQVFYAIRIAQGLACAGCEAVFVRSIAEQVDRRIAMYTAVALFGLAGMYHQGVALLPSSFAMCVGMLGSAAAMGRKGRWVPRVAGALAAFVVASAVGWPYAAVVAVPFGLEQLADAVGSGVRQGARRLAVLLGLALGFLAALLLAMYVVDSHYYGRLVVAVWNQIAYNVLRRGGGDSTLYGTEPWYFYLQNGLLNGNVVMLLALAALPLWAMHYFVLLSASKKAPAAMHALLRGHLLLLPRVLPFYTVLVGFSLMAHKEERFLSIAYPHMCFNAAVALKTLTPLGTWAVDMLRRGGIGRASAGDVRRWVDRLSLGVLCVATLVGFARMAALGTYYGAPVRVFSAVSLLGTQQEGQLLPLGPSVRSLGRSAPHGTPAVERRQTVCMGDEWHHFPSSFWLPQGFDVQFVRGAFTAQLPGDFTPVAQSGSLQRSTSMVRTDFNAVNLWEPLHALNSTETCDYVVAAEYPGHAVHLADPKVWESVECADFLDAQRSRVLARVVYVPRRVVNLLQALQGDGRPWQVWGRLCLFRRRLE